MADTTSLYDHIANRYTDDPRADSFRHEYLSHNVMQMALNNDTNGLKEIIKTYMEQVVATSQQYLVPVQTEQNALPDEVVSLKNQIKANDDSVAQVLKEMSNLQQQLHMLTESSKMLRNKLDTISH